MPRARMRVNPEPEGVDTVFAEPRAGAYGGDEAEGFSVVDRLRLLLEQRLFLLRVTAFGLALATVLAFLIPVRFEARTQLMPPDAAGRSDLAALLATRSGGSLGALAEDVIGMKTSGPLFLGILGSETVEDRIIAKFDLKSVYGVRRMQDARRQLEANTEMSEDRKSGIIVVHVSDHSAVRAAAIAQSYVEELDRLVVELNTSAAHRERVFLEERLQAVQRDLDTSSRALSEFSSQNSAIDLKEQGRAMVEAAATLQGRLIAAQSELEGLRQIYADSNVRVKAVRARIAELEKRLDEMGGGDLASAVPGESPALYPSIRKLPLLGVKYAELYRDNKVQETVFEMLTQQCEAAKVQEAKETPSVKVLDAAKIPERKSFPPRLLIMVLGGFFAFSLASLWLLGKASWEQLDPRHPARLLAHDSYTRIKADLGLISPRGGRLSQMRDKILWFNRPGGPH